MDLELNEQIKIICMRNDISISELARRLGKTPQNFNQQLKRNDFRVSDLKLIADVLNVGFSCGFDI